MGVGVGVAVELGVFEGLIITGILPAQVDESRGKWRGKYWVG